MADAGQQTQGTAPQETATVTNPVTDEALSSAWDATQQGQEQTEATQQAAEAGEGGGQEQQQEGEQTGEQTATGEHEEPADNAERSRLGRRLKQMEDKFDSILARLEGHAGAQPAQQQVAQPAAIPENVTYDDNFIQTQIDAAVKAGKLPETIMTPHDQYRVNQFVNGLQAYIGNQYATKYIGMLKSPNLKGQTPDDVHAEVIAELQKVESPFNLRRYDNPTLDAQMNYLEAKSAILERRLASGKPTSVFKGKPAGTPATGTSVSTRTATVNEDLPALDEASQDFIKRTGMSVESVKTALKSEAPFGLRGAR